MRRLMTIFAFAGGLLGLGNYITEGWTMLSGGRDFTTVSNVASVVLLAVAGTGAATLLLRSHEHMSEEDRKECLATIVLSVATLVVLGAWIVFRALRRS
ncbi:MAG: hypothetical protein ACYDHF_01160 [Candidatus Cryosericum sp.]